MRRDSFLRLLWSFRLGRSFLFCPGCSYPGLSLSSSALGCLCTASSWSPLLCISSGSSSSLLRCFSSASSPRLLHLIPPSSSTCVHHCVTLALSSSCLLRFSPASSSTLLHCFSSASSSWPLLWLPVAPAACSAPDVPVRGASTAAGPWMLLSGGRWFPLLDPPRTIQSGASGLSGAAWPRLPFGVAPRPWLCGCGARCPGLGHPAAVVAWHLFVCRGCGRRRAALACLVAPRGAPRLVRSGRSRCSGWLSRRHGAFPHPGGFRPRIYWSAARGTRRPAENRAHCACRWPPPRQGRWARSALYPFGAPRWGCPWRVPPASVLGCVRCGGWRVWTRSLTSPVSRTVRLSTGELGRCTGAVSCGHRHLPLRVGGRHARVPCGCACARPSWPGPAGRPPGRVLVRRTFSYGRCVFLLCSAPSRLVLPLSWSFVGPPLVSPPLPPPLFFVSTPRAPLCLLLSLVSGPGCLGPWRFVFLPPPPACGFFVLRPLDLWLSLVSGPGCPGPWRCVLFVLLASRLSALRALSPRLCFPPGRWLLLGGCCPPPPPPFVSRGFRRCLSVLVFFFVVRPRCLWLSLVPGLGCPGPWCCWFFLCGPSASLLSPALSPLLCVPPQRWLLSGGCCPPPPPSPIWRAVFVARCSVFCFFFALSFLRCLCPRCLWLSLVSSPGCPWPWRCVLSVLLASRFSARCALSPLLCSRLALGCTLVVPVPPPPPPLCVSRFSRSRDFFFFSFFFSCAPVSPALSGFRPRVPRALALCVVCFVGLPLLGSLCALASFVFPPGRWLLTGGCPPPPPLLCLAVFVGASRCSLFFFFVVRLRGLRLYLVSGPGCPGPWRCVLFVSRAAGCGAPCFASSGVVSCGAAVCGVFCAVPGVVWRACVWLGSCAVLRWVLLCCFCCALLSCVAAFSAGFFFSWSLAFPWCSVLFRFLCFACALRCLCACGVALCALLSCPCCAGWCFVLLSVVFACLLLGLAVLSCLLLSPGGSWCRVSEMCCGVSLGAVLRRVAACRAAWRCVAVCCVVSFCSAWCCRALCRVLGRCPSSCGPVSSALCFVLSRRAVCVLLWCVAACCCALCRVRPGVSCCVFPVLSALCGVAVLPCFPLVPCSPVLCPVVLCCRVVLWCPVLLP